MALARSKYTSLFLIKYVININRDSRNELVLFVFQDERGRYYGLGNQVAGSRSSIEVR